MAKKGVKFDNMSTGQKTVHVVGWLNVGLLALGLAATAVGAVSIPNLLERKTETNTAKV